MKVFTKTIELTKAQIEALDSAPLDVLAAPNVGYAVIPVAAQVWKTAGNAAISSGTDIELAYDGASFPIISFVDIDGTGALHESPKTIQFGAFDTANATGADASKVVISANAAITCAAGTKLKVSVDFKIVKL